jgi:hypothetical protein
MAVRKLNITEADRNNRLWSKVETDPEYQAMARYIWTQDFNDPPSTPTEAAENQLTLDRQIARAAAAVAKLRARGIPGLFLRAPSAGEYLDYENRVFPRATTWDMLLAKTGAPGIHFEDYPELQGFQSTRMVAHFRIGCGSLHGRPVSDNRSPVRATEWCPLVAVLVQLFCGLRHILLCIQHIAKAKFPRTKHGF